MIRLPTDPPLRLVVTGGRDYADRARVWHELGWLHDRFGVGVLAHGQCPTGADLYADEWGRGAGVEVRRYPADWSAHGKAAGPRRNGIMLAAVRPDLVLAFPGGAGTTDCVRQARALGVEVWAIDAASWLRLAPPPAAPAVQPDLWGRA